MTDQRKDNIKLNPCPFCGNDKLDAVLRRIDGYVECNNCGLIKSLNEKSREIQALEWNTRANLAPNDTAMEDADNREARAEKDVDTSTVNHCVTSSATDGDAERLIKYLELSLPQIIYSVREDGSRLLMDYQADMMAEIIIGSIKALQSTRKPPVDTISIKREVLQGVRENFKRVGIAGNHLGLCLDVNHPLYTATYDDGLKHYGAGKQFETWVAWKICYEVYVAIASLDAVLSEGE